AEQVAIRKALTSETSYRGMLVDTLQGFQILHAKVIDGELAAGGGPSCWQCSRLVLAVGLDGVWLYEARPPEGQDEEWCTQTDRHRLDCTLCLGEDCAKCSPGPGRPRCEHDVHDRHHGMPVIAAAWRYYTAEEFHHAT